MKTAQELASSFLTSPDEQKRRALALRRLAGGLRTEAKRQSSTGLSGKQLNALVCAADVLETLAAKHKQAMELVQAKRDARESAEQAVRIAMQPNFLALTSVPDQVALVAAIRSYTLRQGDVKSIGDLREVFKDSTDGLSFQLADQAITRPPQDVVAEAWAKFETVRNELQAKYASVIGQISIDAERANHD